MNIHSTPPARDAATNAVNSPQFDEALPSPLVSPDNDTSGPHQKPAQLLPDLDTSGPHQNE